MTQLFQTAQNWLAQDPDAETRAELQQLLDQAQAGNAAAERELAARFADRLQFGTAGLRGRLQAGSMGMNRVLVAQAAKGLANYLLANDKEPSIVIGYDGAKIPKSLPKTQRKSWQAQAFKPCCCRVCCRPLCWHTLFAISTPAQALW